MPIYDISDPRTGQKVQISAPRPPTEAELRYVWSHPQHALPQSLTDPIRLNLDSNAQKAAVEQLETAPGTLLAPRRAAPSQPVGPLQLFTGVTSAPAAAAMGSLADDPGDALKAIHEALNTAWRAPITPAEDQPTMGGELEKRGVPMNPLLKGAVDIFADPANMIGGGPEDAAKAAIAGAPLAVDAAKAGVKGLGRLYSRLTEEVLPRFKAKAAHPSRVMSDIKNFGSPMEAEWTGVLDWLRGKGNTPVTREEFEQFAKSNPLKIEETRLGAGDNVEVRPSASHEGEWDVVDTKTGFVKSSANTREEALEDLPKYQKSNARWGREDLNLPGGNDYREIVMTLPTKERPNKTALHNEYNAALDAARANGDEVININLLLKMDPESLSEPQRRAVAAWQQMGALPDESAYAEPNIFRHDVHWPNVDNPLAHLRLNARETAEGKQALHIEELQSDWHQQGREAGYKGIDDVPVDTSKWTAKEEPGDPASGPIWAVRDGNNKWVLGVPRGNVSTPEAAIARGAEDRLIRSGDKPLVPNAPYKGTAWADLGMKRAIIEAIESGKDELTWTTGRQQSERYGNLLEDVTAVRHNADGWQVKNGREWVDAGDGELAEVRRFLPKDDQPKFDKWRADREAIAKSGHATMSRAQQHEDALRQLDVLAESRAAILANMRDGLMTEYGVNARSAPLQPDEIVAMATQKATANESPHDTAMARRINEYKSNVASAAMLKSNIDLMSEMPAVKNATFKFSAPLEVGSSGMRQHYDEAMPSIANKIGKPHGAQVKKTKVATKLRGVNVSQQRGGPFVVHSGDEIIGEFPTVEEANDEARKVQHEKQYEEVWSLPITDALRKHVLEKGLPLAAAIPMLGQDDDSLRTDGSKKGDGFFGVLQRPDGKVSTELSVSSGDDFDGAEFPLLVPTLSPTEVKFLLEHNVKGKDVPQAIYDKALAYAKKRKAAGKPFFAQPGEENVKLLPQFKRAKKD